MLPDAKLMLLGHIQVERFIFMSICFGKMYSHRTVMGLAAQFGLDLLLRISSTVDPI